jgi:transaldolase
MTNPLLQLEAMGQSVWLDNLNRQIIKDGELERLIDEDGLKGLTSNPSIFEKAIAEGEAYDGRIRALLAICDAEPPELYERLAVADIQAAADLFRPLYNRLKGRDGYVSLEVAPNLAFDADGTVAEARRPWKTVARPNLMIKAPGTAAGAEAIRRLIGEGVNVTLLFGVDAYLAVAEAHLAGLERLKASGGDVSRVHGVASVFVSRIDSQIDRAIDQRLKIAPAEEAKALRTLRGKVAIANAKLAYQHFLDLTGRPRWRALAAAGASPQRLLWASTGVKDKAYSDVLYVESLIGPDTVNTLPPDTLAAFRDHGRVEASLTADVERARTILAQAEALGLDLEGVTRDLVDDGVAKVAKAYDALIAGVAAKRDHVLAEP